MLKNKVLVLGASPSPSRYAYLSVQRLREKGYPVIALGKQKGTISDVVIQHGTPPVDDIHTVTVYLSQSNQQSIEDYILSLKPARVIFNPGAENIPFERKLHAAGIEVMEACTLVMLSVGSF